MALKSFVLVSFTKISQTNKNDYKNYIKILITQKCHTANLLLKYIKVS